MTIEILLEHSLANLPIWLRVVNNLVLVIDECAYVCCHRYLPFFFIKLSHFPEVDI